MMTSPDFDPTMPMSEAAAYLGCSTKTLYRMQLQREPIPGTGKQRQRFGIRLSVLNACREHLKNPQSRVLSRRSA